LIFKDKLERAMQWEKEQKLPPQDPRAEYLAEQEEPDLSKEVERGDIFAMLVSGFVTIFLPCLLALGAMLGAGFLFLSFFH